MTDISPPKFLCITVIHSHPNDIRILTQFLKKEGKAKLFNTWAEEKANDNKSWLLLFVDLYSGKYKQAYQAHEAAIDRVFEEKGWTDKDSELQKYLLKIRASKDMRISMGEEGN